MRLALFDLDHTLIDFDSGMAFTRHLIAQGALPHAAEQRQLDFARKYLDGTLDIHAMHRATMAPLARHPPHRLRAWRETFARDVAGRLPPAMTALVEGHRARGDLCAVVTATTRLVAEPVARAFGIAELVATEAQMRRGRPTGEIDGLPCFRTNKIDRVQAWLAAAGRPPLAAWPESWFYSDSISDLPLLQAVTHPVAVRPDAALRAHASRSGWAIVDAR